MSGNKKFFLGLVIGVLTANVISVFAQQIYSAYLNELPITVDGVSANIEGYNIDGYTYFKLRDIGDSIGFTVGFNEGVIAINTTTATALEEQQQPTNQSTYSSVESFFDEGETYYRLRDLNESVLNNIELYPEQAESGEWYVSVFDLRNTNGVAIQTLDCKIFNDLLCISKTDFETYVLPLDNK